MLKRIIAVLTMLVLIMSNFFSIGIAAENKTNQSVIELPENTEMPESSKNSLCSYSEYCLDIKSDMLAASFVETSNSAKALLRPKDYISYSLNILQSGWYKPVLTYKPIESNGGDIEVGFKVDGNFLCSEFESVPLKRTWVNLNDEIIADKNGNEFSPEQKEVFDWKTSELCDLNGFITEPMLVFLDKGKHSFTVILNSEKVEIGGLKLDTPDKILSDDEWKEIISKNDFDSYKGEEIVIEGESAVRKSSRFLSPASNRNDACVKPNNPYKEKINYIGSSNWKDTGDFIVWEFEVKQDGLYKIGFNYHQTYLQEASSYRILKIDGKIPFESAKSVDFKYGTSWQLKTLGDKDGCIPVFLKKGKHELSLEVTLGELSEFSRTFKKIINEIGDIYREIVMITGESPDAERDYNLFTYIPDLEKRLDGVKNTLNKLATESEKFADSEGGSSAQILRKASLTVSQMLKKKYKAHTKLAAFYDNYAAMASWLYEMQDMALDIDCIILTSPEKDFNRGNSPFFESVLYTAKRLFASFLDDYSSVSPRSNEKTITLWSNWGLDQLKILSSLIEGDFTPNTGIKVNLKITNASIIQANLSGNGPDVEIMLARTDPINYAIRNAIYDLSRFDDFDEVSKRFADVAFEPYKYKNGIYALPDTEVFSMLFVRTDIFENLNLSVPKTWDDFLQVSKVLSLNNMQVGVAETAPFFLAQRNVDLYKKDHSATNLLSSQAINCLTFWTDLYTKYNFPKSYDFFSRFRTGLIPMGIQPFSFYSVFEAAAPEINGRWIMAPVPGFETKDGTIENNAVGTGTASVILENSADKDCAWQFLKWWTSDDIQYRFTIGTESVLGVSGRHLTANTSALKRLGWSSEGLDALMKQRSSLVEIPEIPGSYYVSRSLQQIYWNVLNNGKGVREMVKKWVPEADEEIMRKTAEYAK